MQTYRDAKQMAKALERALRARKVPISHGESLDLVARQLGLREWNVLSAQIRRDAAAAARRMRSLEAWDFIAEYPTEFDDGLDADALHTGRRAALIRHPHGPTRYRDAARIFGCLAQHVCAGPYHNRRIEVRAVLATEAASHGATIWARVDRVRGHVLRFDNLRNRGGDGWLSGDNGWTERRIVIEVPSEGTSVGFGFFLKGTGSVWATDFSVNTVEASIPLTASPNEWPASQAPGIGPRNLNFSDDVELIFRP